jgi:hypothetical protein
MSFIESLESRQHLSGSPYISASAARLLYSQPAGETSRAQYLTITNTGRSTLSIQSVTVTGPDATRFILDARRLPRSLARGASASVKVFFHPLDASVRGATLNIASNSRSSKLLQVSLRGLGTAGLFLAAEPSLQRIMDTYQIPVRTGDRYPTTSFFDGRGATDEQLIPLFKKAGTGPVRMSLISVFSFESAPIARFGWYTSGVPNLQNEVFNTPAGNSQTITPTTIGASSFDPGAATFGLYATFPHQAHGPVFSQDTLNTWDTSGNAGHKMRVYPYKNANGTVQPNTYVVAIDEATDNIDFQDAVLIISNVKPAF